MLKKFDAQKIQYPDELPEVEGCLRHEKVHGITGSPFRVVSKYPEIVFEIADDWFDDGTVAKVLSGLVLFPVQFLDAQLTGLWAEADCKLFQPRFTLDMLRIQRNRTISNSRF